LWHRQAHLIYNGISQDYIERVAPLRHSPQGPLRRIAIIGRLHPQKGHGFFLEAASLLYKNNPDLEFWIVGTGELRDELENLTDLLGISSAVQFLGTRTDIANILAQVDVLVSSSVWEGFPTVLMEAMAARVPVVATDVSGSRELVTSGKTGILVPPADPTALASAISWLYSHPQEAKVMAENAWQSVRQYGFDCIAAKMAQLYHSLIVDSSGDEPNF
jgi:glycosyltransferase involved in cell wall biosynthesis